MDLVVKIGSVTVLEVVGGAELKFKSWVASN